MKSSSVQVVNRLPPWFLQYLPTTSQLKRSFIDFFFHTYANKQIIWMFYIRAETRLMQKKNKKTNKKNKQ